MISDTHGLLRPQAVRALEGVKVIFHAGDIGGMEVLEALRAVAPVHTVRGNMDREAWARQLPETQAVQIGDISIFVIHDLSHLDLDTAAAGFRVVISGHSHRPSVREVEGVLFVNPGSAGPRRFDLPVSLARLVVQGKRVEVRLIELTTEERNA